MTTSAATAPVAAAPGNFREVWLISLGHGLTHWYPATFYLLLPIIGKELGLSYTEIGLIMSAQYAVGAVTNIPGGILVDAVGYKGRLMALSLFWIGVPYFLMAFTSSYWMLLACMVLIGVGNNLWHPAAISTLGQRFPARKGLALSFHGMGGNLGEALAPLLVGALLAVYSWRTVVVVNLLPGVVMAIAILAYLGTMNLDAGSGRKPGAQRWTLAGYLAEVRPLFGDRTLMLIAASSFFRTAAQSALLTFLPLYLAHNMGYSPTGVGFALFLLQAVAFASAPLAGYASDRLSRKRVMSAALSMTALVIVLMALAGRSPWVIALIALLGFFMYATRPVIQAWSLEAAPAALGGSVVGMMFGVQAMGSAISPWAGGLIADAYDLAATFYFLAALIVAANVLVMFVPDKPR
ncbi:MAG: MFS transporter [Betaproteobacteria bacterium]|nr:MFS transporter [Betaproteobacteria bacterium]